MKKIFLLLITSILVISSHAQFRSLNSANGDGRMMTPVFSQNRFAGQLSAAYIGNLVNNYQNPASYSDASLTAIEIGAQGLSGSYTIGDSTKSSGGVGLSHFSILLPLSAGKSGLNIGFFQHSNTNYGIKSYRDDTTFDVTDINYKTGTGNLYEVFIGTGFRFKNWKVGANISTLFGRTDYLDDVKFPDSLLIPTLRNRTAISQLGMQFTIGSQYEFTINKKRQAVLGGYYTGTLFKNGTTDVSSQNIFNLGSSGYEYISVKDTSYSVDLPSYYKLGIGASLISNKSLLLGTEFNYENFSNYKSRFDNQNLQNAWHIHLGVEYKPFMNRNNDTRKYFNRVTYRIGTVLGKSEQNFNGTINDIKLMGGATLPIFGRNVGYITMGLEYNTRGFVGKNQIAENLFSFHLILTFADKWFLRQKFD